MQKKNIVFYFSDQQRADTCGCYGQPLPITPNLDRLAGNGVLFANAFTPQPVCGPCRALFQTGQYPTRTGCFRNNIMLPAGIKTLGSYMEDAGYETAYVGKWHLASDGDLNQAPVIDHTITAIPKELRGGYTGFWRAADVLEFTSHGYDGYVFDENNRKILFTGYRADCINGMALEFLDVRDRNRPFFLTVSQIEPHHQNDRGHYEGPVGSKEKYRKFELPGDLKALGGNAACEYPDYLGQCASLDENLGRLIAKLKEKELYEDTIIIYTSDHGSHFRTRNLDAHLNGGDDYKRTGHDAALKVPLVIAGGAYTGGQVVDDLVSTESLPKTILAMVGVDVGDAMIGENLLEVVEKKYPGRENQVFAQISESRIGWCIRTPEFLYAIYAPGMNGCASASADVYADDYLYDMRNDPYQLNNVVEDAAYPEIKADLRRRLLDWMEKAEGNRPVIIDSANYTQSCKFIEQMCK
ncbi:MAG: sulfatase-like hydrolase/transferase [Lachnospiraceae bacterium]|nr:sulfatase-like hydrolase/transferase [Lachnospiraceae bacterium]